MSVKISLIQLTSGNDVSENIGHIAPLLEKARNQGAELACLPENAFYMRAEGGDSPPRYDEAGHPGVLAAREWAGRLGMWILVGSVAVKSEDAAEKRLYNRSLLIDAAGNITARYDKIHLFDVDVGDGQTYRESVRVIPGDKALVADTPWGKLGMTVCYDVRFPQLYRALAQGGTRILAVPAAFTQVTGEAHWHVLLRARAIENGCFVIAPAQAGTHPGGRKTYGHSLAVNPWGEVLADAGGEGDAVVTVELDLSEVDRVRGKLPSLQHDRDFKA